tara:strand:- start:2215 stop:3075 length:861 start_codon:yes stop_codon:yes gene_type:complete
MFKKFFRKVRETVKKVAPIAAPLAGAYLGPLYGAGIGALLGQYGGTKGALQGAIGGGLGGLLGNYGTNQSLLSGGGFRTGNMGLREVAANLIKGKQLQDTESLQQLASKGIENRSGGINNMLGMLKNPYVSGGLLSAAAAMMNKKDDDPEREEIEVGSQGQLGDMRVADIEYLPAKEYAFPSGYAGYAGYANGGIVALAKGGTPPKNVDDFPRKNGNIAGPGTMTSDDIPAMLSDGEFVTKAVSVIGAGVREGADTIEEAREKGSDFFYQQQNELAELGERLVNGN